MSQAQVTPEEAYYVVLRTVVAGNQANWVSSMSLKQYLHAQGLGLSTVAEHAAVMLCRMSWATWRSCAS